MNENTVERLIRALMVSIMNGLLYFSGHRRVKEAAEEAVRALDEHFEENTQLVFNIREGLIIYEGKPLYDLSIYAHRLISTVREQGGWGLRFEADVTDEEIIKLVELLIGPPARTVREANELLRQQGAGRVTLEEQAVAECWVKEGSYSEGDSLLSGDHHISQDLYTGALATLQNIMVDLHHKKLVSLSAANDIAQNLTEALTNQRNSFIALTAVKDYDSHTFNHSVNVCIYAATLAESVTLDKKEVVRVAQAALLHDVGKLLISDEILNKPAKLSREEWEIMQKHTTMGAKILMESEGGHDLAVNVAFGHHLRYDQEGYPQLTEDITLDPVTQLVQVIDFYEAVTAKRPYKKPFPPEWAAHLMMNDAGTLFNPLCVDTFLRFFGVYPPATRVRLDNGCTGWALNTNPDDPFRPMVRMTHGPDGEPLNKTEVVDTAERNPEGEFRVSITGSIMDNASIFEDGILQEA